MPDVPPTHSPSTALPLASAASLPRTGRRRRGQQPFPHLLRLAPGPVGIESTQKRTHLALTRRHAAHSVRRGARPPRSSRDLAPAARAAARAARSRARPSHPRPGPGEPGHPDSRREAARRERTRVESDQPCLPARPRPPGLSRHRRPAPRRDGGPRRPGPGIAAWAALPERDRGLLLWLVHGDVVTAELAGLLAYGHRRIAQRRLARLVEYGLLAGSWAANRQRPRGRYAYALTKPTRARARALDLAAGRPPLSDGVPRSCRRSSTAWPPMTSSRRSCGRATRSAASASPPGCRSAR